LILHHATGSGWRQPYLPIAANVAGLMPEMIDAKTLHALAAFRRA
jgi:hypothetical protein